MELKGFTKLNESTAQELLKDDELTIFENMVLDEEIGKPKKRFGWQIYNDNAVAGTLASLHEVVTSDGSNYLLAGHSGKLQKALDGTGTWSDVSNLGTPPYKMQPYADEFIFTDGSVPPFIVSGASLGSVANLEIEAPDIETSELISGISTVPLVNAETGLTPNSYYKYIMVYVTATGQVSPPSMPFTNYCNSNHNYTSIEVTTGLGNILTYIVGFADLPVSSDARVTTKYIYRTMANSDVYYFHSSLENWETSFVDSKPDSELGSESFRFLNCPASTEYIALHKERIIFGYLTRIVKNWIAPTYSKMTTSNFSIRIDGTDYTFTNSSSTMRGIKDCYAANTVGATLPEGSYIYRFVFLDTEGITSDVIDTNEVSVASPNNSVVIPVIPSVMSDLNTVTRAKVYRSNDSGSTFGLIFSYDPRRKPEDDSYFYDSGYTDEGDTASTAYSSTQTTDTEKCGVAFSDIGQPATFILEDVRNIFPDDGDEITGVFDDQDGILIFKLKSICKIYTNGAPDNWRLVKVLPNIGCDEPNSLVKYGNTYAFSFQSSIYTWNSQSGLKEIGIEIWDTLAQVTAYHCAAADSGWYMFGISGGGLTTGYGFLIYDYNANTWYKFTTTTIPYVAKIKENGDDVGTIITSNANRLLNYSDYKTEDLDTGLSVQITPKLRTKTFGESIALQRLRKLMFNYSKKDGKDVVITITNPDDSVSNTYTDNEDAAIENGWKLYKTPVKDTDLLKVTSKFYIDITGAGLLEFGVLRVETYPVLRGLRDVR